MENAPIVTVNVNFKLYKELGLNIDEQFKKKVIEGLLVYAITQIAAAPLVNIIESGIEDEEKIKELLKDSISFINNIDNIIDVEEEDDEVHIMFRLPVNSEAFKILSQIARVSPLSFVLEQYIIRSVKNSQKLKKYLENIE